MTKKDYIKFAAMIKGYVTMGETVPMYHPRLIVLAQHIADIPQDDNPRFDRERFLVACGMKN